MRNGKDWAEWITRNISINQILCPSPCFVTHICLSSTTGGVSTTSVYNGVDANAELKLYLAALQSTHFTDDFSIPVYFDKGLYVALGSNVASFVIQYRPCERS